MGAPRRSVVFAQGIPKEYYQYVAWRQDQRFFDEISKLDVNPHILIIGQTGSGKGLKGQELIESAYRKKIKIISIHNPTMEIEHAFKKYPAEGKFARFVELQGDKPRGYPVKVYAPVCKDWLPEKLPPFFELFTVPVANFPVVNAEVLDTITMVPLTDIGRRAVDDILQDMDKDSNFAHLFIGIKRMMEEGWEDLNLRFVTVSPQTKNSLHRLLFMLLRYRMMSHASHPLAMRNDKFLKILNDQEEISVFTQYFAPPGLHPFLALLTLQYIFQNASKCEHAILVCATEIQKIMRNPDTRSQRVNPAMDLFSEHVAKLVGTGRKFNIHFMGDTPSITGINHEFVRQASVIAFHTEVGDNAEKEALVRRLKDREYGPELLDVLHGLSHDPSTGLFEYYSFEQDREYRIRIPRSAHPWEQNRSDFLKYVEDKDGTADWKPTGGVYKEIEDAISKTAQENIEIIRSFELGEDKNSQKLARGMEKLSAAGIAAKTKIVKPKPETRLESKKVVDWLLSKGFEPGDNLNQKTYQLIQAELGFNQRKTNRLLGVAGWYAYL